MNLRRVLPILGLILYVLAVAQVVPLLLCLVPPLDRASGLGFGAGVVASALLGLALRALGEREGELYRREGVVIVVGAWLLASLAGAVPYLAGGAIDSPVDALFESASGFTTTGASILVDIEALSAPMLFWRSMTQWLGGVGIVVLLVALLAELGPGARFLFALEVPGPKAEILHARVRETALVVFRIYLVITALQVVVMLLLGVGLYDAVVHAFSTVSTGGFSPHAHSAAHFPPRVQAVILVFMLVAGANFMLSYALVWRRDPGVLRDAELRVYLGLAAVASLVVATGLLAGDPRPGQSAGRVLLDAAFQSVSILTTTGFATADFAEWPAVTRALLVGLMFAGGCAGSTAGGVKIVRLLIGWRAALREVQLTFSPNAVVAIAVGERAVPEASVRGVVALLLLWAFGWALGTVLLSVGEAGIVTGATASIATLSNVGPGLAAVGPEGNFAFFEPWQKAVMVLLMWLGRLELFAVLALLQPRFWRK